MDLNTFFQLFDSSRLLIDCEGLDSGSEEFQKLYKFLEYNDYNPWNGDALMDYLISRLMRHGDRFRYLKCALINEYGYRRLSCCRSADDREVVPLRDLLDMLSDERVVAVEDFEAILI